MIRICTAIALAFGLILAACGESAEDKAQKQVCSARADIRKQVDDLKGLTISTESLDAVKSGLKTIRADLKTIAGAQGDLKGDRKQAAQKANETFKSQVSAVGRELVTSRSASDAKQQIQAALDGLAASYKTAFAPIDCAT